jgi:menaquinone-9 beta-reductase
MAHNRSFTALPHSVDVAVIGGGVAGGALGAVFAEAGLSVVIVEREATFRDRIRGESIHPWGARELDSLGLLDVVTGEAGGLALPFWLRYRDGVPSEPYAWTSDFPDAHGEISVAHPKLQETLLAAAAERGALVLRPATAHPTRAGGSPAVAVETDAGTATIRCRLLVGADGQRSALRRWLGGTGLRDPVHHAIGGTLLAGLSLDESTVHQTYFDGGFAMIFPQRDGKARIYYVCGTDEAAALQREPEPDAMVARVAAVLPAGTLAGWRPAGPTGFFPNADVVSDVIGGDGVVLIGDAAGANDPSQGHGLSLVFRDIRELRDLLLSEDDWSAVPTRFAERRHAYFTVLREHAKWAGQLATETGPDADALRERVARARELDPTAGGFAALYALGPDGLAADDTARRHFFGEDLSESGVGSRELGVASG